MNETGGKRLYRLACEYAIPPEVAQQLVYEEGIEDLCALLNDPLRAEEGAEELHERLLPDENGLRILAAMVRAAETAPFPPDLPGECFSETMRAFGRFTREHKKSYGYYGFDRWFWTWRQTSGQIVRIGSLEYEFTDEGISIHIPSDADLREESVRASLKEAKKYLGGGKYFCRSWMLSPKLKRLLPEQSNVRKFRSFFTQFEYFPEDDGYRLWVFGDPELKPRDFPEDTVLQRNMKKFVLHGGKVGAAYGVLRKI